MPSFVSPAPASLSPSSSSGVPTRPRPGSSCTTPTNGPTRPSCSSQERPRLKGKAGVVAQALLLHQDRAWQVKKLAEEARVSGGLAHRVLARLETEGIVAAQGTGPKRVRRITDPTALLDL